MDNQNKLQQNLQEHYEKLLAYFRSLQSVAVAFSGGVDSTLLLKAAKDALGDRAVAVTAVSASFPGRERDESAGFCRREGIRQIFFVSRELETPGFRANPQNRCYLCKRQLFGQILEIAGENGLLSVVEGSNLDDTRDYRPGLLAVAELGVLSPLRELEYDKKEIRRLSMLLGLPTWNKPSFACLASRFPYGEMITDRKLKMVEEAEDFLRSQGFGQLRVRIHECTYAGPQDEYLARIELMPEELTRLLSPDIREKTAAELKKIGFAYSTLDLTGYRTGSLNELLPFKDLQSVLDSYKTIHI